jgi:hypothetical protein
MDVFLVGASMRIYPNKVIGIYTLWLYLCIPVCHTGEMSSCCGDVRQGSRAAPLLVACCCTCTRTTAVIESLYYNMQNTQDAPYNDVSCCIAHMFSIWNHFL